MSDVAMEEDDLLAPQKTTEEDELLTTVEDDLLASHRPPRHRVPRYVQPCLDPVLSTDSRVLTNLLVTETHHRPTSNNYIGEVQLDVTDKMRKIVADWMLEVCEEQRCSPQVFLLAVSYVDRLLCKIQVRTSL